MRGRYASVLLLAVMMVSGGFVWKTTEPAQWNMSSPVAQVLYSMGDRRPTHDLSPLPVKVRQGEEIVRGGRTTGPDGNQSRFVSKYYVCTSCHNVEQEDPDLRVSDPEARLPFVKAKGIPFLQGTTFRGIVNRESWYNDDYVKKYGEALVGQAHEDLRESIQLCAVQCSQGRPMEDWEVEAVLSYFWTLQWTLGDLGLDEADYARLNSPISSDTERQDRIQWLKQFGYPGLTGDPASGRDLYDLSCLQCHQDGGVSSYLLDHSHLCFEHLYHLIPKDDHKSLYQIVAYGTYAIPGHRPYMPHYPAERMSKQQVEDLRAYITEQATGSTIRQ